VLYSCALSSCAQALLAPSSLGCQSQALLLHLLQSGCSQGMMLHDAVLLIGYAREIDATLQSMIGIVAA
jgi:hypothetical protein